MKRYLIAILAVPLLMASCSKDLGRDPYDSTNFEYESGITHDMIILGEKLENPYTVDNVGKALASIYPTKARVDVETTNLYVRFLPADDDELSLISDLELTDHPLDYSIAKEGDWYHDPAVDDNDVTWMYAVVDKDYVFPPVKYEIIDECFLTENRTVTRGDDGIDWEAVIRESYRLTGNGDMLLPETKAEGGVTPKGRITIVDPDADGGKPVGVAGVQVVCNSFVRFSVSYTDIDGYYSMDKTYTSDIRYRIVFKNQRDFALGFNFILVPASVSTLGKTAPEGVNVTVTSEADPRLFRRCVVNNAVYDFIGRCTDEDLGIAPPPSDLRVWLFPDISASSAVMLHHGTVVENAKMAAWLGVYAPIVTFFSPDLTIGLKSVNSYKDIYTVTTHEVAHACHFKKVGKNWWNQYIAFILSSFLTSGGQTYGTGTENGAGYCEVGEMWAYYLQSKVHKDRYGGNMPSFGTAWWFYPQIFRYLDERGIPTGDIFEALAPEVTNLAALKSELIGLYPGKESVIEQVFSRYE